MGKKDAITKDYMNDPCIFADAFNFFMYDGRQVILPEQLHSLDAAEIAIPYVADGKGYPIQKFRDNLKYLAPCRTSIPPTFFWEQRISRKSIMPYP